MKQQSGGTSPGAHQADAGRKRHAAVVRLSPVDVRALAEDRTPSWLGPVAPQRREGENDARLQAEKPPHW